SGRTAASTRTRRCGARGRSRPWGTATGPRSGSGSCRPRATRGLPRRRPATGSSPTPSRPTSTPSRPTWAAGGGPGTRAPPGAAGLGPAGAARWPLRPPLGEGPRIRPRNPLLETDRGAVAEQPPRLPDVGPRVRLVAGPRLGRADRELLPRDALDDLEEPRH